MRWTILVAMSALMLVGVASAASPSTVTAIQGTWLHGDAASLSTVDGDTLDIQSAPARRGGLVGFIADYPAASYDLHYAAWAEPHAVHCGFASANNATGIGRATIGTTLTSGTLTHLGGAFDRVKVKCRYKQPFVIHFDLLTTD